ncbi:efflux RND transporter periplasmic adaptor subunit [Nitrospira moscoviensis]|nr:efflux RND transporter periplasmic adaptor subunit [Nitrospira moscoviensis]
MRPIGVETGVLITIIAVAAGWFGACGRQPDDSSAAKPVPGARSGFIRLSAEELARAGIEARPIVRGPHRVSREFPATIQANENELAEVTTLIRGRVVTVQVDVGADVKKGDLLALLHSTELGLAESAYVKAAARLHEADLAYRRAKDLHENKVVSLAEFLRREAEMKTAQAEARETRNRLELLGVSRREIERLDREGTIRSDVPLLAPFDGRVIMRNITRGEVVETHQKFFTVADLSEVWVIANVPEKDVEYIQKGQTVDIVAAAYPHALFQGAVTYIGDVLDAATRTLRVRVTAPNPEKRLKPEMFALVRVYAAPDADVLAVPLSAVQSGPTGKVVFVQRAPAEFEARTVRLGPEYGDVVVILDGLQDGEPVVTRGAFVLRSEMERHKIEPAP